MTPAVPVEDGEIETSLSVVSSSLLRLQKVEADMRLMVTDTVTRFGCSDEETDFAVTPLTPRRPRAFSVEPDQEISETNVLLWCD